MLADPTRDYVEVFSEPIRSVAGYVRVRSAIERALKHGVKNANPDMDDMVTAVRWMTADLALDADIVRLLINRVAVELGKEVDDLAPTRFPQWSSANWLNQAEHL